jgi:CBS domain-containing protein
MEEKIKVSQLMTKNVVVANLNNKLSQVLQFFTETNIQHLPVSFNDVLLGIVSIKDILKYLSSELKSGNAISLADLDTKFKLEDVMSKSPVYVHPNDLVEKAIEILSEGKFQALPVVEEGKIVGIVTNKDIVRLESVL